MLLNINSWSAGCTMWSDTDPGDTFGPASTDDQMLEVVGLYSSLHVGRILVSMADPIRLGQARHVRVRMLADITCTRVLRLVIKGIATSHFLLERLLID